jgi:uncharacterized protein (TIGR02246 family)
MADQLTAIQKQRARWIDAINESSPAGFVAVLTDDVVWLPSRSEAIIGKENIRAWLKEPFERFDYEYSVSDVRVRIAGDWAIEQAAFSTKATTQSGEAMPVHEGQYSVLWRKTSEGEWLIERYIDHSADFVVVD